MQKELGHVLLMLLRFIVRPWIESSELRMCCAVNGNPRGPSAWMHRDMENAESDLSDNAICCPMCCLDAYR
jgi:hypothetical protein